MGGTLLPLAALVGPLAAGACAAIAGVGDVPAAPDAASFPDASPGADVATQDGTSSDAQPVPDGGGHGGGGDASATPEAAGGDGATSCDPSCAAAGGTCQNGACSILDNEGNVDPTTRQALAVLAPPIRRSSGSTRTTRRCFRAGSCRRRCSSGAPRRTRCSCT